MSAQITIKISGSGRFLPGPAVSSAELDAQHGFEPGYLEHASGVRSRHYAGAHSQIEMGVAAAEQALEQAGLSSQDIGLVVSASGIPFQALPSTAPLIMGALGIKDGSAAAFDVNSSCASFVSALELVGRQVSAGVCDHALIVSSEVASRGLPWEEQPDVAALFGDGAAAVVVSKAKQGGICHSLMRSYPSQYDACEIGAGGTRIDYHGEPEEFARHTRFRMSGKDLFRVTAKHFPGFVDDLLARAGWRIEDVDVIVPHQASPHALRHMVRQLGFQAERIVNVVSEIGNQIAASIPTGLDMARRDGRAKKGSKVLILGTSAGVSFAGLALQL